MQPNYTVTAQWDRLIRSDMVSVLQGIKLPTFLFLDNPLNLLHHTTLIVKILKYIIFVHTHLSK